MRPALPALLLAVLLVTSGCAELFGQSRPQSDQRALDAVNRSQAAVSDVESYRFSLDGESRASDGDEQVRVDVGGHGVVDVTDRRMNVTTRARDQTRRTYVAHGTAYTECARMGWGREDLSGAARWLDYTPAGQQLALLDRTDVYWRGTRALDGTEVGVVEAYPTVEELQAGADGQGTDLTDVRESDVENVTVTAWVSEETGRLLQASRTVELERNGATATASVTFRFDGYDEPVNVTRPPVDDDDVTWEHGCPGG